ncbi:ATP-binding protein [uncultured Lactobacillus sp.]|uniref:ATP-binding protein n=1 Tax=uncultured Lactobacillus sp. TaxID=153152 RepID=UPI0025F62569|nr:ATP-binding protein [uncultured Lactobacillus sp.]
MARIIASGNILNEISQIPSCEFALKELIKNSYEALASEVHIDLNDVDPQNSTLTIKDDGNGMTKKDIDLLLNLSWSTKKFGSKINNRYVSGSKGIGFFSVFKFGKKVTVKTRKKKLPLTHIFSIELEPLLKLSNISDQEIPVIDKNIYEYNGTEITIENLDKDTIDIFKDLMADPGEAARLSNMIHDDSFKIYININKKAVNNDITFNSKFENAKIAEIKYNSTDNKNNGYNNKYQIIYKNTKYEYEIPTDYESLLSQKDFRIELSIKIYNLVNGARLKDAPKLFYFSRSKKITPLLYINNSIFSDNNIYNIEINSSKKSKFVFRQQIGFILIYLTNDKILNFNSDRTRIVESPNYRLLTEFTDYLSSKVPYKLRELMDNDKINNSISTYNKNKINNRLSNVSTKLSSDRSNESISNLKNNFSNTSQNNDKFFSNNLDSNPLIKVNVGEIYPFDDLITLEDSKGGKKVAPQKIVFNPEDMGKFNEKERELSFEQPGTCSLRVDYIDKISGKSKTASYKIKIFDNEIKSKSKKVYIASITIKESEYLNYQISEFKKEINKIYNMNNLDIVFVSSLRTFVELLVKEIASILKIPFDDNMKLKKLLNEVIDKKNVNNYFFSKLDKATIDHGLGSIYTNFIDKQQENNSLIDMLNIYTHSGINILDKQNAKDLRPYINFLFSYLNFITEK